MVLNANRVILAGRLTRDPELKQLNPERTVVHFALAVNERGKNPDGTPREHVTFVDCEAWGRTAENIAQYLRKGSGAYLEGRLRTDAWEDKDGNKRSRLKLIADHVQFLDAPREREDGQDDGESTPGDAAEANAVSVSQPRPVARTGARPAARGTPSPRAPAHAMPEHEQPPF